MTAFPIMRRLVFACALIVVTLFAARADAASATLFRIFLTDGSEVVSYGEYARVGAEVVFSMAMGGSGEEPRVHLVTLPAAKIDWTRTERYSEAARAAHYATTRGDDDFAQLSGEVARVLNDIALSTDPVRALALAQRARDVLAKWPDEHYHYREGEVRDILSIIDASIVGLKGQPSGRFDLALVSSAEPIPPEAIAAPDAKTQISQLLHVADLTPRAADRVDLLQAALALVEESAATLPTADTASLRATIVDRVKHENDIDASYARFSRQITSDATRAAQSARASEVERLFAKVAAEDRKLGGARPEVVQALRATIETRLDDARRLRLLRDQWAVRRHSYEEYQRRVGNQIVQLVKVQSQLDAIRRLDGPSPERLLALKRRLQGGADRLQRLEVPVGLESVHGLLIGAWRFAENAANGRYDAVSSGDVNTAWTASSAAAGAMMLFTRAQDELRTQLEVPKLK